MHDAAQFAAVAKEKTGNMVYLAGPIDSVKKGAPWRDDAEDRLHKAGISFFKPWDAYSLAAPTAFQDVMNINRLAIAACSGVLAFLPYGVFTVGTIREIEIATQLQIPVVVMTDTNLEHHVSLADVLVCHTVCEAVEQLKKVM